MTAPRLTRLEQYDRLIRRFRNDPRLWDEDDRVYNLLGKAQAMRRKLRKQDPEPRKVGPYSGMTKRELAMSGTCETDWF